MQQYLQALGLDAREAVLYLACLRLGSSSPATLTRQTKMKRSTVYFYLDRLQEKGLVTRAVRGKRKHIVAAAPATALRLFMQAKEQKLQQERDAIQAIVPKLANIAHERATSTHVQLYEGASGIRAVSDLLVHEHADNYWFGSVDNLKEVLGDEVIYRRFTVPRMQQKTTGYGITDRRVLGKARASETLGNFRRFRFVDGDITLPAGYMICGQYTAIAVKHERVLSFIVMKDPLVAELMRTVFLLLWDRLPAR